MPSDKPGLLIRRMLMDVLAEHGEVEMHAGNRRTVVPIHPEPTAKE